MEPLGLSIGQQALWTLYNLAPDTSCYNVIVASTIDGDLDVGALKRAVSLLLERHEMLRSTFSEFESETRRFVGPGSAGQLKVHLMRDADTQDVRAEAQRIGSLPFDLRNEGPFRSALLVRNSRRAVLVVAAHHIVCDLYSFSLIWRDIFRIYSELKGSHPGLGEKSGGKYEGFVHSEDQRLPLLRSSREYWLNLCSGVDTTVNFPTDKPRPPKQSFRGRTHVAHIPADKVVRIRAAARTVNVLPFRYLASAFEVLIHKYTGETDFLLGCPTTPRLPKDMRDTVGYFVNPIVLRARIKPGATFREISADTNAQLAESLSHRDYPFPLLVKDLGAGGDLSHSPVFQIAFSMQSTRAFGQLADALADSERSGRSVSQDGLRISAFDVTKEEGQFDLAVVVIQTSTSMRVEFRYSTDLFEHVTIERLSDHYFRLIDQIIENPEAPIEELTLVDAHEQQVLKRFGDGGRKELASISVCDLIANHVFEAPQSVAVTSTEKNWTYSYLHEASGKIASSLYSRGVRRGDHVAVMMQRSPEMVATLLAVLRSGAVYLPLDPKTPIRRLRFMLEDSKTSLLCTTQNLASVWEGLENEIEILQSDRLDVESPDLSNQVLDSAMPQDAAYVIYTSGSTGMPKGVTIEHAGLLNLAQWQIDFFRITHTSAVLQFASASFDASIWEIIGALAAGARIFIPSPSIQLSGDELQASIDAGSVSHALLPPSVLATLDPAESPTLTDVVVGGEVFPDHLANRWIDRVRLYNAYGPSETTVCAAAHQLTGRGGTVPIGRPLPNHLLEVRDKAGNLVPVGVRGELYVAGIGVGRGYLNLPAVTHERFTCDASGNRTYKTGDIVRWNSAGALEYIGREDGQLKVRGNRVELGEVESVLNKHPLVADAVARVVGAGTNARILGYVIPETQSNPPLKLDIRNHVIQWLPRYMVPSSVLVLDAFPRTQSGKIDYETLPLTAERAPFAPPSTRTEKVLCSIWADVLDLGKVGIHDDFFDLGGNSLAAASVKARFIKRSGVDIPLAAFFERATISKLSAFIDSGEFTRSQARDEIRDEPKPGGTDEAAGRSQPQKVPLSTSQEKLWKQHQRTPGSPSNNYVLAMRLEGQLILRALREAFNKLVTRHATLRTCYAADSGAPYQVIKEDSHVFFDFEDLSELHEEFQCQKIQRLAHAASATQFDLAGGNLFKVLLLRMGLDDHTLILTGHRIIGDGPSSRAALLRDLSEYYAALAENREADLPPLSVQYTDYAYMQRNTFTVARELALTSFQREYLRNAPRTVHIAGGSNVAGARNYRGGFFEFTLQGPLLEQLKRVAREGSATLYMTLLSIYGVLLSKYSGEEYIVIGSPVAIHEDIKFEKIVGPSVSLLPMQLRVFKGVSFSELLAETRRSVVKSLSHRDLSIPAVGEPDFTYPYGASPVMPAQFLFALHRKNAAELQLGGVRVTSVSLDSSTAKFDLSMHLEEQPNAVVCRLQYSRAKLSSEIASEMASAFCQLAQNLTKNPHVPIV
ncbi:amino acid adenylation domain-containing protein [Streptomyces sp. NPDC002602]|uniref:amino acid adenylation domain-containing protein n=1 Tax=Streptomyces sp. NPDC002602 TaxID=3364654 RepID=UPI0036AC6AEA